MGGTYTLQGDYSLPGLTLSAEEEAWFLGVVRATALAVYSTA